MNDLRSHLEAARNNYRGERYGGDLGELVAERATPRPTAARRRTTALAALAASALIALAWRSGGEPSAPTAPGGDPIASVVDASPAQPAAERERPRRYRGAAKRMIRRLADRRSAGEPAWTAPLAFARPTRPKPTTPATGPSPADAGPPTTLSTNAPPRRLQLSPPSLAPRSLSRAISLGTST